MSRFYLQHLRLAREFSEGGAIGARHEDLTAERGELFEESAAARGIEMRRDLVQEQDRRDAGDFRDEPRMREDEADEQCLLLAGRGARRIGLFRPVPDEKIG